MRQPPFLNRNLCQVEITQNYKKGKATEHCKMNFLRHHAKWFGLYAEELQRGAHGMQSGLETK